jgi:hypothetical protein
MNPKLVIHSDLQLQNAGRYSGSAISRFFSSPIQRLNRPRIQQLFAATEDPRVFSVTGKPNHNFDTRSERASTNGCTIAENKKLILKRNQRLRISRKSPSCPPTKKRVSLHEYCSVHPCCRYWKISASRN